LGHVQAHETVPIVPLRDLVLFPYMTVPFVVGRPSSTRALEHALAMDKRVFVAAQHDAAVDNPQPADIYTMGCVANIVQSLKLPDGNIKVLVEGVDRARVVEWKEEEGFFRVGIDIVEKKQEAGEDADRIMGRVVSLFERYLKLSNNVSYGAMVSGIPVRAPDKLADTIAAHLPIGLDEKQRLLEISSPLERLNRIGEILEIEVEKVAVERRIQARVEQQIEKLRAEYYLAERRKAIQSEVDELKSKVEAPDTPQDLRAKATADLERLEAMSNLPDGVRVPAYFQVPGIGPLPLTTGNPVSTERLGEVVRQAGQGWPARLDSPERRETHEETNYAPYSPLADGRWVFLVGILVAGALLSVLLWLLAD
jgi:ATP-dependent Lon protease